jgi:hypothetical protein
MADDVTVSFAASIEKLIKGVEQATESIEGFAAPLQKIVGIAGEAAEAFMAAFAVERLISFAEQMGELGLITERTMAQLGLSATAVGELAGIAKLTGTSLEGMTTAIERLSLGVQKSTRDGLSPQAEALKVLGLNAKELIGLPADEYFDRLAEAVSKFNPSLNLTNALMQLGGRGVTQLIPMLQKGAEGFHELKEQIEATGATLSGEQVQRFAETHEKMTLLGMATQGVAIAIFDELRPAFDGVVKSLTDFVEAVTKSVKEGGAMATLFEVLGYAAKIAASAIVGVVAVIRGLGEAVVAITQLVAGDIDKFKQYAEEASKEFEKIGSDLKKQLIDIWSIPIDVHAKAKADAAALAEASRDRLAAEMKRIEGEIKLEEDELKRKTLILDGEVKLHQMTQNAKFASLMDYTDKAFDAELALLEKEKQLAGAAQNLAGAAQKQTIDNKIAELHAKHNQDMIKLDQQSVAAQQKIFDDYFKNIQSAFNSQLRGLLAGTTSWSQAFKNILGDLLIKFIEIVERMAFEWAAGQLAQLTASQTGAAGKATAELAGQEATLPARIAKFTSDITADAAAAFAGVFANLAPAMGPAAAGPAGASSAIVMTQLAAVPKYDVGADLITRGGMAYLHAGEKVVTAQSNGPYTGNSGGDTHVHFNISAWDGSSVNRWLNGGGGARQIARALKDHLDLNPSMRPTY